MKSICLISGSSPKFLGGVSLYQRNLIRYAKKQNMDLKFTWIYAGRKNKKYDLDGIRCIEIKALKCAILKEFDFARKVKKIISKKHFDIINTHANWGYCLKEYEKKNKKIIHTYHGVTYPYMKIQFAKFGFFKYLFYPLLPFFYILEKPPIKKADSIICVSEKVKIQIEELYGKKEKLNVIRTGVDLSQFKKLSKDESRKELKLDKNKIYGLYSGRGGYWNKGLDRAIKLSKEIFKLNKDYKLIIMGANKNKCKKYLNFPFVDYRGIVDRKELPKYYSASDFFFFLSRYEGGAPTLALSEAIASECLTICSKDSKPEILKNKEDCLILEEYNQIQSREILTLLKNNSEINKMKTSAKLKLINLSLDKWGKKYFEVLLK